MTTKHPAIWIKPAAALLGALLVALLAWHWLSAGVDSIVDTEGYNSGNIEEARESLPVADRRASALIEKHECWVGEAPKDMTGVIPGHVVLTLKDGRTIYDGSLGVEAALQQVFGGADYGLRVHAFCR